MSKRTLGIVLMVAGVVAVVVSLGADSLGIGGNLGIGWKQALGAVVRVIVVAVGASFWPGFPLSRMMADPAGSAPASGERRKPRTPKGQARPVRKGPSRGSRRGGRK